MFLSTLQMGVGEIHPVVLDWFYRVKTNGGGTLSSNTIHSVSRFYNRIVANGLSSSLKTINVFAPDSLIAATTPLVIGIGNVGVTPANNPWTNTSFVSADISVNGLQGNGSKYLNTGQRIGNYMTAGSALGVIYVSADDVTTSQNEYGATDSGGAAAWRMYYHNNDLTTVISCYGNFPSSTITAGTLTGYLAASRISTTQYDTYYANSVNAHSSKVSLATLETHTPSTTLDLHVFATNENNSISNISKKRISFACFGTGITSTQSSNLFNAVQQMRKELGGGWT